MWACNPYQIRTPFNGHIEKCEVVTLALHGWAGTGCYIWYSKDGTVGAAARPGPSSLY